MRPVALVVGSAAMVTAGTLTACSNDTGSYKDATEDFLEEQDGDVVGEYEQAFTDAECEEPGSTDVGTTYICTAVGEDGTTWIFDVEIDDENSFSITNGTEQG